MERVQENEESMILLTELKLSQRSPALVLAMAGVNDAVAVLNAKSASVQQSRVVQAVDRTGDTVQKKAYREVVISKTLDICNRAKSYGLDNRLPSLVNRVDLLRSNLEHLSNLDCAAVCQGAHDAILPLVGSMGGYGLTALMLTEQQASITVFTDYNQVPRDGINTQKSATETIATSLADCREAFVRIDASVKMFEFSHPVFFKDYFHARQIINTAGGTLALRVHVSKEDGTPLEKVKFNIEGMNLDKKTSNKGNLQMRHLAPGPHRGSFKKYGFKDVYVDFVVNATERTEVEVVMNVVGVMAVV